MTEVIGMHTNNRGVNLTVRRSEKHRMTYTGIGINKKNSTGFNSARKYIRLVISMSCCVWMYAFH
jgi:hypothetical protein